MTGKVVDIFSHMSTGYQYILNMAPKGFILDNVKGLTMVTHQDTFKAYLKSPRDGLDNKYIVSWRVLNTADFGLPQPSKALHHKHEARCAPRPSASAIPVAALCGLRAVGLCP